MDPTIERRVDRLEEKVDRVEAILVRLVTKIRESLLTSATAADLAEIKGRIGARPTWWMLMVTVLTTGLAGAGRVFTLVEATHP